MHTDDALRRIIKNQASLLTAVAALLRKEGYNQLAEEMISNASLANEFAENRKWDTVGPMPNYPGSW